MYSSARVANTELEIDHVPNDGDYYYGNEFNQMRSKGEITDTEIEKVKKISIKPGFSKYDEKFLKGEVKSEISDFKPPSDLNEILIKVIIS